MKIIKSRLSAGVSYYMIRMCNAPRVYPHMNPSSFSIKFSRPKNDVKINIYIRIIYSYLPTRANSKWLPSIGASCLFFIFIIRTHARLLYYYITSILYILIYYYYDFAVIVYLYLYIYTRMINIRQ